MGLEPPFWVPCPCGIFCLKLAHAKGHFLLLQKYCWAHSNAFFQGFVCQKKSKNFTVGRRKNSMLGKKSYESDAYGLGMVYASIIPGALKNNY